MSRNDDKENFVTILGVVLAGVIQISSSSGPFSWWNVIFGVVLALVLWNYSLPLSASLREKAALSATWGFVITSGSGILFQWFYMQVRETWLPSLPVWQATEHSDPEAPGGYYFILWIIFSTITWLVIKFNIKKKLLDRELEKRAAEQQNQE